MGKIILNGKWILEIPQSIDAKVAAISCGRAEHAETLRQEIIRRRLDTAIIYIDPSEPVFDGAGGQKMHWESGIMHKHQIEAQARRVRDNQIANIRIRDHKYRRLAIAWYEAEYKYRIAPPSTRMIRMTEAFDRHAELQEYERLYVKRQEAHLRKQKQRHAKLRDMHIDQIRRSDLSEDQKTELIEMFELLDRTEDQERWGRLAAAYSQRMSELRAYDESEQQVH